MRFDYWTRASNLSTRRAQRFHEGHEDVWGQGGVDCRAMKRLGRIAIVVGVLAATAIAQEHKISVQKFEPPKYPPIARQARISGEVKLALDIGADGRVTDVKVLSGHPMLQQAAVENVKLWKFHCDDCGIGLAFHHEIKYAFSVAGNVTQGSHCASGIGPGFPLACYLFPRSVDLFVEGPVEDVIRDPGGEPVHSWLWRLFHIGKKSRS
jgi:TonB family protein